MWATQAPPPTLPQRGGGGLNHLEHERGDTAPAASPPWGGGRARAARGAGTRGDGGGGATESAAPARLQRERCAVGQPSDRLQGGLVSDSAQARERGVQRLVARGELPRGGAGAAHRGVEALEQVGDEPGAAAVRELVGVALGGQAVLGP